MLIHLFNTSIIVSGFYAVYWLFLRKLTFHSLNRWYLLIALAFSVVIPGLPVLPNKSVNPVQVAEKTNHAVGLSIVQFSQVQPVQLQTEPVKTINWESYLFNAYWFISILLLLQILLKIGLIIRQIRRTNVYSWQNICVIETNQTTASFFHWVFLNSDGLTEAERELVLQHEYQHFRHGHSIDLVLIEVAKAFLWFNPVMYWLDRSLRQIHEYEVDQAVAKHPKAYAQLLLKLAMTQPSGLTHTFARQPLKSRIEMLFAQPSSSIKKTFFLIIFPLCGISVALFAEHLPARILKSGKMMNQENVLSSTDLPDQIKETKEDSIKKKPALENNKNEATNQEETWPRSIMDGYYLGKNPVVVLNGKRYDASILRRIDPEKLNSISLIHKGISFDFEGNTVNDGKIELNAREGFELTDPEKIKTAIQFAEGTYEAMEVLASDLAIIRISKPGIDGKRYNEVKYRSKNGNSGSVILRSGERVEFYLDGIRYSEEKMQDIGKQGIVIKVTTPQNKVAKIEVFNKLKMKTI
ncbi:MAG: M56 family metallopeptidase [Siphonobacter sp.]